MQKIISGMLDKYERGRISRRQLVQAFSALVAASTTARAVASTFQGVEVNHVALNVTDVKRSRDFYQKHLGLPARSRWRHGNPYPFDSQGLCDLFASGPGPHAVVRSSPYRYGRLVPCCLRGRRITGSTGLFSMLSLSWRCSGPLRWRPTSSCYSTATG